MARTWILLLLLSATGHAQSLNCGWVEGRRVSIEDGWIDAEQGRDEDAEKLRIAVWGPERVSGRCEQLDRDFAPEVWVTSRGQGTGPYYRLQIIDFQSDGIKVWSYASHGMPRYENDRVFLGELPEPYDGAASTPVYSEYRFTEEGLVGIRDETDWMMFVTVTVDDSIIQLPVIGSRSRTTCEIDAQSLVEDFEDAGLSATFMCMSNVDVADALKPFID